jgi:hypothetical protein
VLSSKDYINHSLEINLFFLRLAKEHAIFAAASLPPRDRQISRQLIAIKNNFESLLSSAVMLSQGVIHPEVLASGEIVTDLTLPAEAKVQELTGIPINMSITRMELALRKGSSSAQNPMLIQQVSMLNQQALKEMNTAIAFKEKLLTDILNCRAFSYVYPSMLHHIIEESRFYASLLMKLQSREDVKELLLKGINWNEIMEEHAEYIRGYLDPTEEKLFKAADTFAKEFEKLKAAASPEVLRQSLPATTNLRNFKRQGTEGILACKLRSVIPPLLADHVTREANHYLRLLKTLSNIT